MDAGDFVYLAFFAFWLFSQIAAVRKRYQEKELQKEAARQQPLPDATTTKTPAKPPPPIPSPAPVRTPAPSMGVGAGLVGDLNDLRAEIDQTLPTLDERVRAQVSFLVDRDFRIKAEALARELDNESSPEFPRAAQEAKWLSSHYRGVLQTARVHSSLRGRGELQGPRVIADSLTDELDQPRSVTHPLPPPVAIVWDVPAQDRLRDSALADATLFVPRTVVQDPSHWSLAAPELARYLSASAPELYQEIYRGLDLGAAEAQVGNDPRALTRVLYASWIGRVVADATGALWFGPAYLLSIAKLYAQPDAPARVTSIVLNRDGTVHPEPPVHVRVHVTARWLTRMGYASEAAAIRREWDEAHGSPEVLGFWGSMTSLPADQVLDAAAELTDELFKLPLDALGSVRLAHVPGLAGWEAHAREASSAKTALLKGTTAKGSARALVAGAIEAALSSPGDNVKIHTALHDSLVAAPTRVAAPVMKTSSKAPLHVGARPSPGASPFAHLTGRDVAEALIVGDILLERRAR